MRGQHTAPAVYGVRTWYKSSWPGARRSSAHTCVRVCNMYVCTCSRDRSLGKKHTDRNTRSHCSREELRKRPRTRARHVIKHNSVRPSRRISISCAHTAGRRHGMLACTTARGRSRTRSTPAALLRWTSTLARRRQGGWHSVLGGALPNCAPALCDATVLCVHAHKHMHNGLRSLDQRQHGANTVDCGSALRCGLCRGLCRWGLNYTVARNGSDPVVAAAHGRDCFATPPRRTGRVNIRPVFH